MIDSHRPAPQADSAALPHPSPDAHPADPDLRAPALVRRMACWVYEGVLMFAIVFMAGWLFSTLGQMRSGIDTRRPLLQAFLFIVFGIYFGWFWSRGQTLAMKTWKIRLLDALGRPVTQTRALLRYLLSWAWFLPPLGLLYLLAPQHLNATAQAGVVLLWVLLWALLSRLHPQGQFWHDALAGTRLVNAEPL